MARNPFGGKKVSFAGRKETLESVFGVTPLLPSDLPKKLWAFIKANNLFASQ